jgi:hypothetical protein
LTWNVSERVQAYTNPLWLFLFSACYWLTEEASYTPIFLSIAVSLTAAAVLVRCIARSAFSALLCLSLLLSSKAFVDYLTSGLENPLTHLLLALFLSRLLTDEEGGREIDRLALCARLGMLNRMDAILLFAPGLAVLGLRPSSAGSAQDNPAHPRGLFAIHPVGGIRHCLLRLPVPQHSLRQAEYRHRLRRTGAAGHALSGEFRPPGSADTAVDRLARLAHRTLRAADSARVFRDARVG